MLIYAFITRAVFKTHIWKKAFNFEFKYKIYNTKNSILIINTCLPPIIEMFSGFG